MDNIEQQISSLPVSKVGKFFYHWLPYRKNIIKKNINNVFADKLSNDAKEHLIKAFYSHIVKCIGEILLFRFKSIDYLKSKVQVRGYQTLLDIHSQGKGVLILTGHFGNWEVAPIGGILNFEQYQGQFHFIRRTLKNKFIEKILFKRYYKAGLNVIPKNNSLDLVKEALDNNHAVVFVLDQHANISNKDGIPVEFFGKKAGTYRSLASFARYTGVPVVPAAGYRLNNGEHVLEFFEPIYWEDGKTNQESILINTSKYNQALEKIVLKNPEQWLWLHNRWKL